MRRSGGAIAGLAAVVLVVAAVVVLEWLAHTQTAPVSGQSFSTQPPPKTAKRGMGSAYKAGSSPAVPQKQSAVQPTVAPPTESPSPPVVYNDKPSQHGTVVLAPDAPPKILGMTISAPVATAGQVVSGTVQTSSNVASVEARIAGFSQSLTKTGVGQFSMSYTVPNLPPPLHRTWTIEVIARNTRGDATSTTTDITIR